LPFNGLFSLIDLGFQYVLDAELGEAEQQAADLSFTAGDLTFEDESGSPIVHIA
jgi:hypothetical protein